MKKRRKFLRPKVLDGVCRDLFTNCGVWEYARTQDGALRHPSKCEFGVKTGWVVFRGDCGGSQSHLLVGNPPGPPGSPIFLIFSTFFQFFEEYDVKVRSIAA